jgi:hypothetical protein
MIKFVQVALEGGLQVGHQGRRVPGAADIEVQVQAAVV